MCLRLRILIVSLWILSRVLSFWGQNSIAKVKNFEYNMPKTIIVEREKGRSTQLFIMSLKTA